MDLLGSILDKMDKPPPISEKELERRRKQREEIEKRKKAEADALKAFRDKIEKKIAEFLKDTAASKHEFEPMQKVHRSIIHDVAEVAGVAVFSVGDEDIDRRVLMYKKEFLPCEAEIHALRRGEVYDPQKSILERQQREREDEEERFRKKDKFKPNSNYKEKYSHLIGTTAGKEASIKTETNKQYGFVPASNKKDVRSIEQTMADIQSRKRQKINHPEEEKGDT